MKKFLLLLLVLCMAAFASPGWAKDVGNYNELVQALNQDAISTISLSDDITVSATLPIERTLTLDGNGHKLTGSGNGSVIKITKGNVTIKNLTITGGSEGGLYVDYNQKGSVTVENCTFTKNTATSSSGGGIYAGSLVNLTVTNCVFEDNKSSLYSGGGVCFFSSVPGADIKIEQCTFINNHANGSSGDSKGGGLYLELGAAGKAVVENCTFTGNSAYQGSALNMQYGASNAPTVHYCTFVSNPVTGSSGEGCAIYSDKDVTLNNSILYQGKDDGDINNSEHVFISESKGCLSLDVKPVPSNEPGKENIPHTVFRVSEAKDKGTPPPAAPEFDQLGTQRRKDGKPTIGAVEIATAATVATPTFSLAGGTYTTTQTVTISCATDGATIYYTTDGSTPTTSSPNYTGAISVSETTTLKAIAVKGDMTDSDVATATYTITPDTPDTPDTPTLTAITITLHKTSEEVTVEAGDTAGKEAVFTVASAKGTFSDGKTTDIKGDCTFNWTVKGPDWITPVNGTGESFKVTARPDKDVQAADNYTANITVTPTYNKVKYDAATVKATFAVTVTASGGDPSATVESISVTITPDTAYLYTEPGGKAVSATFEATATARMSDGTTRDITPALSLKNNDRKWITIDGSTVTASPGTDATVGTYSATVVATATSGGITRSAYATFAVTLSIVEAYEVTVAPVSMTALTGQTSTMDLKDYVHVEKLYENGKRVAFEDPNLTFTADNLPSWLSLSADGTVTASPGTDIKLGAYDFAFSVTVTGSGVTKTEEGALTVNVKDELTPVRITSTELPEATTGSNYSAQLTADGETPIRWSLASGSTLPDGLTLDPETGRISGRATVDANTYKFTVRAENDNPSFHEKELSLVVTDIGPSGWKAQWNPATVTKGKTFTAEYWVANGTTPITYAQIDKFNSDLHVQTPRAYTKGGKAGTGYIKFICSWTASNAQRALQTHNATLYNFNVRATNAYGTTEWDRPLDVTTTNGQTGIIASVKKREEQQKKKEEQQQQEGTASIAAAGPVTIAGAGSDSGDGIDSTEGKAPSSDSSVTYYANGGEDEDGNITAVIGKATAGFDATYVFKSLSELLNSKKMEGKLNKVVRVEFRKGAELPANGKLTSDDFSDLVNLADLSIDECNVTKLGLKEMKTLVSLSLFDCGSLSTLALSGCDALETVDLSDCGKLENVDLNGCKKLASISVSGCNELTELNATGCSSLEALYANGCSSLTSVNATGCDDLKVLSLADAKKLWELTLPGGAVFDEFTLTGSRVLSLDLNGGEGLTALDLSGNVSLDVLNLKGCTALKELDVTDCGLIRLDVTGFSALERLTANGCRSLTTLTLDGCSKLRELGVGGCNGLRTLDVRDKALGHLYLDGLKWLTKVQCDGQFRGGIAMSQSMNLKDYAGPELSRVSDIRGYAADGSPMEPTSWNATTGEVTFASAPASLSYAYNTGLYDFVLGVTVSSASERGADVAPTSDRDGGGCNAGLSLAGLAALALLLRRHRR